MNTNKKINAIYFEKSSILKTGIEQIVNKNFNQKIHLTCQNVFSFNIALSKPFDLIIINITCLIKQDLNSFLKRKEEFLRNNKKIIFIVNRKNFQSYSNILLNETDGILHINSDIIEIITCLKEVLNNNKFRSQLLSNYYQEKYTPDFNFEELTAKEIQVLELMIQGVSTIGISKRLFNSVRTIDAHRRNIALKLDKKGPGNLTRFIMENKQQVFTHIFNYKYKNSLSLSQ